MSRRYNPARPVLHSVCPMRAFVLAYLVVAAACSTNAADALYNGDDGGGSGGEGGPPGECQLDSQCYPAAARCCDCPTYAMPESAGIDLCAGVTCPMPGPVCSTSVHVACVNEMCQLACDVTECDLECPDGFATDASGCVACACYQVASRECMLSTECAETPADCCGCALGGTDTAVVASDVDNYEASLDCPPNPECPGVSTCQADLSPQCVQGACALQPALPENACGRPDLPLCGMGMVCAVNSDPLASAQGVGVCIPAS
jgi:hypothetical protein